MGNEQLRGLFVNCVEAQDSIYESGRMAYDCLVGSDKYSLDYAEITKENVTVSAKYDFYFFNYHFVTMSWLDTTALREILPGAVITMVLEISPNDPFVLCSPDDFDIYCVLDPTLNIDNEKVFAFPRPLEKFGEVPVYKECEIPLIGSFGLGTPGKGYEHLMDAVNMEFDKAHVRINIPFAQYWPQGKSYAKQLAEMCKERAKEGIQVTITHDYMSKTELIEWCSQNTINCFFYDRKMPGLAATTDQAIASGRPLLVSKNDTFRHIQKFVKPFPYQTLRQAIETSQQRVEQIQKEWSPKKFLERFENVLENCGVKKLAAPESSIVTLRTKPPTSASRFQMLRDKAAIRTRAKKLAKNIGLDDLLKRKRTLRSHTRFGEDVVIHQLLDKLSVQNVRYLDIALERAVDLNNTCLFYERGCFGVLVESGQLTSHGLKTLRPRDTVISTADELNVSELISRYFTECPDLVLVNTETDVLELFETIDFDLHNPAVFCVASAGDLGGLCAFLEAKGYVPFDKTEANTIFLNRNLYDFYEYQQTIKSSQNRKER